MFEDGRGEWKVRSRTKLNLLRRLSGVYGLILAAYPFSVNLLEAASQMF
jgi:hypothetical protein